MATDTDYLGPCAECCTSGCTTKPTLTVTFSGITNCCPECCGNVNYAFIGDLNSTFILNNTGLDAYENTPSDALAILITTYANPGCTGESTTTISRITIQVTCSTDDSGKPHYDIEILQGFTSFSDTPTDPTGPYLNEFMEGDCISLNFYGGSATLEFS